MKITLPVFGLLIGAALLPVAGYTADSTPSVPTNANETPAVTKPAAGTSSKPMRRSNHPIDDSVITTKVKAKFLRDKRIRGDNIEIKTVNGTVELTGTAGSRSKAKHAVALAHQVKGVKSVKNDIEIAAADTAAAGDNTTKTRTADRRRSDQPVDDTWITTKVKAKLTENKLNPTRVHVKTLDGVVELSGIVGSTDESSKAAALAGGIKGVKSVTNDLKVN